MGFGRFWRRRAWDEERSRELNSYIEEETAQNIARGMAPEEARFSAIRKLGGTTRSREEIYDFNTLLWFESLCQDLRYAARLLRRDPGFATVAILSLALGIGANTAIFQLLNAVRLKALPVEKPHELVTVEVGDMSTARGNFDVSVPALTNPQWELVRDRQQAFSGMLAWSPTAFNLAPGGDYRGAQGILVSGDFFKVLGLEAVRGRLFSAADDVRGCGHLGAVLSYSFWQREYGGDPNIVGRTIALDDSSAEIIGVAPSGFNGLDIGQTFDVALPLCSEAIGTENNRLVQRSTWWVAVMGRLKPGWTAKQASDNLASISPGIMADTVPDGWDPLSTEAYRHFKLKAYPAAAGISQLRNTYEKSLWLLLAIAAVVLLIACANLANLLLARATARSREIAVRVAIGAARSRVVRQLFSESILLAFLGSLGGLLLARWLSKGLVLLLKTDTTAPTLDLGTDWRLIAFATAVGTLTAIVFGLAPALAGTRTSPTAMMNAGGRSSTTTRERHLLRRGLVVSQVALSLVLLFGAFLFVRSLTNILTANVGMKRDGILVGFSNWNRVDIKQPQRLDFERRMVERLGAVPGVQGAASIAIVPLVGWGWNNHMWMEGQPQRTDESAVAWVNRISPGFFDTEGITMLRGRNFDAGDSLSAPPVAIVNETFARTFAKTGDPTGKRFWIEPTPGQPEKLYEIVGVVHDTNYRDIRETKHLPIVFLPESQNAHPGRFTTLLISSALPPDVLLPGLRKALSDVNPAIVTNWTSLNTLIRNNTLQERLLAELSGFFGGLACLLAVVGLYGVMSYIVARRTNEIGVRIALGANRADVVLLVVREATVLVCFGLAAGIVLSLFAGRVAASVLFGLTATDPFTIVAAVLALAAVSLAASYLPARRAAKLDPMAALRSD